MACVASYFAYEALSAEDQGEGPVKQILKDAQILQRMRGRFWAPDLVVCILWRTQGISPESPFFDAAHSHFLESNYAHEPLEAIRTLEALICLHTRKAILLVFFAITAVAAPGKESPVEDRAVCNGDNVRRALRTATNSISASGF